MIHYHESIFYYILYINFFLLKKNNHSKYEMNKTLFNKRIHIPKKSNQIFQMLEHLITAKTVSRASLFRLKILLDCH